MAKTVDELCELKLELRMPWWMGAYLHLLLLLHQAGLIRANSEAASKFITSWARYRVLPGGRWSYLGSND
jgi:hypothetical protein